MENKKVMIENCVNHEVGIVLPELGIRRTWERKGAKKSIDLSLLREAMYEPGVEYMFTSGMLYIDDLEVKKELGLEPEDATAPVIMWALTYRCNMSCEYCYLNRCSKEASAIYCSHGRIETVS